ncbi:hypothetical protein HMPREF9439_02137 [Parasutterella excrementihominis YIT 11859]|uniref:Uncharacterized protein n=1 Tax=Parasutterella excrementihominis YIT 11859 TaxID=762966 RepID=F3QMG2_9BURK|nr:hypothetical protein HMPREF9439_02137 [Parasutterella excrementihominis YIT 11859]
MFVLLNISGFPLNHTNQKNIVQKPLCFLRGESKKSQSQTRRSKKNTQGYTIFAC